MAGTPKSFRNILLRNEYRALLGKNRRTVYYLFAILFVSFFAFGFARSTLRYQDRLASDPFSNHINLECHAGNQDSLKALERSIREGTLGAGYHIRGSYFCNKGMVSIETGMPDRPPERCEARSIASRSDILQDILARGTILRNFPDSVRYAFAYQPNGVILSRKITDKLGLDTAVLALVQIRFPSGDCVPVPVLAVVEELPDRADMIYTNLFYCKSMNPGFFDRESAYYRLFAVNYDTTGILRALKELYAVLEISDPASVETTRLPTGHPTAIVWKIEIGDPGNGLTREEMDRRVATLPALQGHPAGRWYMLSEDTSCDPAAFYHDFLVIEFSDMKRIRPFAQLLRERFGVPLDLETLTDRENYLYTGNIALGSLILLMVLATFFVAVYIAGTLRNHLLAVKKNLGNFLAFGVKNRTLTALYIRVTLRLLVAAMLPAALLAWAAGTLFERFLLGRLLVLDPAQEYFSLANGWFLLFLALIPAAVIVRTFVTINRILRQTPGNLIYERDR